MSTYGTPFVESEAILAAQQDDHDTLYRLVGDMLPSERRALAAAARRLRNAIDTVADEERLRQR